MDMLNFGIVFPLLPSIAEEFNANAMQAAGLTSGIVTCYLIGGCSQATTNKFYCIFQDTGPHIFAVPGHRKCIKQMGPLQKFENLTPSWPKKS